MQDRSIDSALIELRAQIIRGGLDGLVHVEALLIKRGVGLPRVPQPLAQNSMPRRGMAVMLTQALSEGPKNGVALAAYVAEHQPAISYREAQRRVHQAMTRLVAHGVAVRDGKGWRLVGSTSPSTMLIARHDSADHLPGGKAGQRSPA